VPPIKQKVLEVARGLKASLNRRGSQDGVLGLRRAEHELQERTRELDQTRRRLSARERELAGLRAKLAAGGADAEAGGVDPNNIVWIFGTARTGSTWLAFMMQDLPGHTVWREPYVGELFGRLHHNWAGEKHSQTKHFILGRPEESWLGSVRAFVLNEAAARFPEAADGGYLVIKEPNGAIGAPLLLEALPESRLVFLIRDPRDVVASALDASRKGSWLHERRVKEGGGRTAMFDMQANTLVERTANRYLSNISGVDEAYRKHKGYKVLVRYEDLVADTPGTMRRLCSSLKLPVDDGELARVVEKHSWENIPEEKRGEGKFFRKGTPGSWREDLTPEQAESVERITAPLLEAFYP